MKKLLIAALLVCFSMPAFGAVKFVRAGASGSNNGTSWTNAWTSLSSMSASAGDFICVAGGTYSSLSTFANGTSGNPITIRRAFASDPVCGSTTSGWNATYDSQVVMTGVTLQNNYVTIDGSTTHGIKITMSNVGGSPSAIGVATATNGVTLRYIEVSGPCTSSGCNQNGDARALDLDHWNGSSYDLQQNLLVHGVDFHGQCTNVIFYNATNLTIENSRLADSIDNTPGNPNCHPNVIENGGSSNFTFRYNEVVNWQVEGIMNCPNGACSTTGTAIYGNIFHDPYAGSFPRVIEAQYNANGPYLLYNNTFVNIYNICASTANGGSFAAGTQGRNNLFYGNAFASCGLPSEDYDYSNGSLAGETHGQGSAANPFINYTSKNFQLSFNTNAGLNLGSPYNTDYSGNARTTWSRGAYEYQAAPIVVNFSNQRIGSSFQPTPFPLYDRMGDPGDPQWSNMNPSNGTYSFGSADTWIAQTIAKGSQMLYTFVSPPGWANGTSGSYDNAVPPTDINTTATCPAPLASAGAQKDCFAKAFATAAMQHFCGVSSQPVSPLVGVCFPKYYELWNELNSNGFWTGSYQDLAQMMHDVGTIIRLYCGDCTVIAGSTTCGGDGFNPAGGSSHCDAAMLDLLTRLKTLGFQPDAISFHPYPSRTTVQPVPMPETIISNSDPLCTTSTPSSSCRFAIKDVVNVFKSTSVLCNAAISSWACPSGVPIPIWTTEGGWGENVGLTDSINGSITYTSIGSTTATFTASHNLPANWVTGTYINMQGTGIASPNQITSGTMNQTAARQITKIAANKFTYPTSAVSCDNGPPSHTPIVCTSSAALGVQITSSNTTATTTWSLRQAYISRWMIMLAIQGSVVNTWYATNEACWGTLYGTNTHSNCTQDAIIPTGYTPAMTAWTQTMSWLNGVTFTSPLTQTAVSGGNIWTVNLLNGGVSQQLAWYDGWLGTTTYTVPLGTITFQNISGIVSPAGATITLGNTPVLLTQSMAVSIGTCGGNGVIGGHGKIGVQ